jgi:hypothetical protein
MLCVSWGCGGVKVLPLLSGFPVICISNISPRFYFRKHAFCFLPLAAILESPPDVLFFENTVFFVENKKRMLFRKALFK